MQDNQGYSEQADKFEPSVPAMPSEDKVNQLIIDSAPIGIALQDIEGKWLRVNDALCRMLGYEREELLATDYQSLTHPEEIERDLNSLSRISRGEITQLFVDKRYLHKKGHYVQTRLYLNCVSDESINAQYLSLQIVDINEQVLLQDDLIDVKAQLHGLVQNAPLLITIKKVDGTYVLINNFAEKKTGRTVDDIIGKTAHDILDNSVADIVVARDKKVIESGECVSEEIESDDSAFFDTSFLIRDKEDKPAYIGNFSFDISEQRKIQREFLSIQAQLDSFINNVPASIALKSIDGRFILVNQYNDPMFPLSRHEIIGKTAREIFSAEMAEIIENSDRQVIQNKKAIEIESENDGRFYLNTKFPVFDHKNNITSIGNISFDITERKILEQQMRLMFNAAPNGMIMIDEAGKIIMANQAMTSLFGYDEDELLGEFVDCLVPERYRNHHHRHRQSFFAAPSTRSMGAGRDLYGIKKGGAEFPVEIGLNPIETTEGLRVISSIVDITGRKRVEQQMRLMFDAAPIGMIMIHKTGTIVMANQAMSRLFGYDEDELLGESVDRLVPERYRGEHGGHRQSFFNQPKARSMGAGRDLYGVRKDGSEFPVEIGLNPIETTDGVRVISSIVDITERKRIEKQIRLMFDAAPNGMIMIDKAGVIVMANQAMTSLFGYDEDELLGESVDRLVPERYRDHHGRHRQSFFSVPKVRSMGAGRDLYGVRKDGSEFPVEIGLNPIETTDGARVISSIVDITERKDAELNLKKYTEELLRSNKELEQFAYVASHDLQEPLRMVASFTELLGKRYQDKLDQRANEYIGFAIDGAKRMQRLINDLLQYSRIGSEKKEFVPVNCNDVFLYTIENLSVAIEESKAEVVSDELPVIFADDLQISLLFQNLIGNAIKYSAQDRVNKVHVSAERRENDWLFCVKDQGIGISGSFYERIFVIFQRLHGKSEYGGTGIGLAICRKIIERHGGEIWVESKQGEGSEFYFTLPIAPS